MRLNSAKDLGSLVRQTRKDAGWTQLQLAGRVGVSRDWIIRFEQGKGTVELALVLRTLKALELVVLVEKRQSVKNEDTAIDLRDILNQRSDR